MEAADNREHFENQWRQAFSEAGVTPPPMVWHKIEATLATQKESGYRKTIFYYRMAAAAMAIVAAGLGAVLFFNTKEPADTDFRLASESAVYSNRTAGEEPAAVAGNRPENVKENGDKTAASNSEAVAGEKATTKVKKPQESENDQNKAFTPGLLAASEDTEEGDAPTGGFEGADAENATGFPERMIASREVLGEIEPVGVAELSSGIKPLKVSHIYSVARVVVPGKEKNAEQPLLASLGVGAGAFDPNYSFRTEGSSRLFNTATTADALAFAPAGAESVSEFNAYNGLPQRNMRPYQETNSQGGTFSVGGGIGKRVFKKLLVHAGLYYGRFNSGGSTNLVLSDSTTNRRYAVNQATLHNAEVKNVYSNGKFSYQGESAELSNRYEFLTVPLKMGFILLDGRTGLILNTGLSGEVFLSNKVQVSGEGIEDTKTKAGENSPYKNVYFNGTLGLEVNYQIAANYKVVFEPYYRHALTTFTKNSEGLTSSPRIWGVQAGLRYELR